MAAKDITLEFTKERETKGTHRFTETVEKDADPVVGKLYIKKAALKQLGGDPEALTVTIKAS